MRITGLRSFMTRDRDRPRVIVALDTDEGISGWGECYNHGPDRALPPLLDYLFLQIEGHDPRRIEFLIQKLLQQARFPPGALGLVVISAIDHALWDISAKAWASRSSCCSAAMRATGCGSTPASTPRRTRRRRAITSWSCGSGGASRRSSSAPIGSISTPIPGARSCAPAPTTSRACARSARASSSSRSTPTPRSSSPGRRSSSATLWRRCTPLFFEEPIRPEHIPAWAELKARLQCPLATGESLYSRFEFLSLLSVRGADIIQPDICAVGGLLEMRRIAALAEAHYVTVAPHNPMGLLATAVNVHFCAAQPNFKILEYRLPDQAPYVKDPYLPKDGWLELRHDRPGWGIEIDEEVLRRDDYIHWQRKLPLRPDGSTGYV